jgi:hypothetical protein
MPLLMRQKLESGYEIHAVGHGVVMSSFGYEIHVRVYVLAVSCYSL